MTIMIKNPIFLCLLILIFLGKTFPDLVAEDKNNVQADSVTYLIQSANAQRLYEDPTWLRLLHFRVTPRIAKKSDVLTTDFFLAYKQALHGQSTDKITAQEELTASIEAFFQAVGENPNSHAQCRFPARYYWLNKKLNLDKYNGLTIRCTRLENWAKFQTLDSVSLIMVSGYFGNPASTFGHLLVKLNNSEFKSSSGNLLDQSINYGAQVPDDESIPVYIAKGIFGGYVSRFADKKFYTQDLVYSKHEFRDMWEYELELSEEQNRLLVYHIWEMLGVKSRYYFLKQNCGYRIAELLELVTGQALTPGYQPWYLPISVFQGLEEIEGSRYIKKISFLPSSQRKLHHAFNELESGEATAINKIIENPESYDATSLEMFPSPRRIQMIEFLLDYYQYKLSQTDLEDSEKNNLEQYKKTFLLERFALPVQANKNKLDIHSITSPAKGALPRLFRIGIGHNDQSQDVYEMGISLLHSDSLSNSKGSLENSELSAFDINLEIDNSQKVTVKKFDIISIQKLGLNKVGLYGESDRTWRVSTGFEQTDLSCINCTGFYLGGGQGSAKQLSDAVIVYAMLNAKYIAENDILEITPDVGVLMHHNERIKSVLESGLKINIKNGQKDEYYKLETRYSISTNNTLRLSFEKFRGEEIKLSFFKYF